MGEEGLIHLHSYCCIEHFFFKMVENTSAFDSESSSGSFNNTGGWGVVSNHGSDTASVNTQYLDELGLLILDGAESSNAEEIEDESELTIPGTYSLPTDVGTIEQSESGFQGRRSRVKELVLYGLLATTFSYLLYERSFYRSSTRKLRDELRQTRIEMEETIQRMESKNRENIFHSDDEEYFTILDNCWIKAQTKWCDASVPTDAFSFPLLFGEKIGEVGNIIAEKFKEAVKEVPGSASKEFKVAAEAMNQASEAFMNDYKDAKIFVSSASDEIGKAFKRTAIKMTEIMDNPLSYFDFEPSSN